MSAVGAREKCDYGGFVYWSRNYYLAITVPIIYCHYSFKRIYYIRILVMLGSLTFWWRYGSASNGGDNYLLINKEIYHEEKSIF